MLLDFSIVILQHHEPPDFPNVHTVASAGKQLTSTRKLNAHLHVSFSPTGTKCGMDPMQRSGIGMVDCLGPYQDIFVGRYSALGSALSTYVYPVIASTRFFPIANLFVR